jgi:methylmalonyl-CoA/ethylmalonyl-CoA epimerase
MIGKIDHIGIAVNSIEEARPYYEKALGLNLSAVEEVSSQKVRTAFFDVGGVHIELLEPTSAESPVAKFIQKNGPGIHHLAFGCDSVENHLAQARQAGCTLINETPLQGAGGKRIAFLHPKSTFGVLTELCSGQT